MSKVLFMCHMYRSSHLHEIIVKLNSITDNVLPETMIQDIREIDNVNSINSIMTLTIPDYKINCDKYCSLSLGNLELEIEFL